ncbi:MAG: glycosyltransferase [Longimicrobiales bacterium]|nr:glycosyltransferase [Longimicrobiales bacterium]
MSDPLAIVVLIATGGVLAFLLPFALHRSWLLWVARTREPPEAPTRWTGELPRVTVQLPVYNERGVVERLIDAACSLDYPREKLEIQLLDDSTDDTSALAARAVARWRREGVRIRHLRRGSREGYKAGALAHGLESADGELILVLDADFVPEPDLLHRLLPPFQDPGVGMVQGRWDHLNEEQSWLTRAQALLLDGHFFFEQGGRWTADRFFNFNGTAGMWRRRCLDDAGGWEADTLTEDLDLSYRAQMKGWRFVFLEDVGVPAEVPARAGALEVQQKRWAQGGIQTARKILPRLLRGSWSPAVKLEAVIHLCGHLAHPLTLVLGLLLLPSALARRSLGLEEFLVLDLVVFGMATVPFATFYAAAGRKRSRPWRRLIPDVIRTLAVGIGLSAPVSRAVLRGVAGARDPFLRTPKDGGSTILRYPGASGPGDAVFKLVLGAAFCGYVGVALLEGMYASIPFLLLFGSGYLSLAWCGLPEPLRLSGASGAMPHQKAPALGGEPDQGRSPDEESEPGRLRPGTRLLEGPEAPVAEEYEAA